MNRQKIAARLGLQMDGSVWDNLRYDVAASILFSFLNVAFNQFFVPLAIRDGATHFQVGLLTAAPAIGLLLAPLWAGLVENRNPKPFVVIPNIAGRLLILLPALVPEPWVYVGTSLVYQGLMGIQAPAYAALIPRIYPAELRGRLMGNVRMAMGALMIPVAYWIGHWIDAAGGRGPLITGALTGVVSILLFSKVKELVPAASDRTKGAKPNVALVNLFHLLKGNRELLLFLAATSCAGFGNLLAFPLYQIIQVDRLELTNAQIGYGRMIYYACLLLAYWLAGWIIDRHSPKRAMVFGLAACGVIPVLYALFGNYAAVLAGSGMQGIADAIWDIGCLSYIFRLAPGREASAFGLHLMLFGIRGTIGPLLSTGIAGSVPLNGILWTAAVFCWIGFALLVARRGKTIRHEPSANLPA
jgi:MFS family permease